MKINTQLIKEFIKCKGYTQRELSAILNISASMLSHIINGDCKNYNIDLLGKLCSTLGIRIQDVFINDPVSKNYEYQYVNNYDLVNRIIDDVDELKCELERLRDRM